MFVLESASLALQEFFDAGGDVLWAIFAATLVMWMMIIERFWFLYRAHAGNVENASNEWSQRTDTTSWHAQCIRRQLISTTTICLQKNAKVIQAVMVLLPLLGLLGTVTGMIQIFNVMAVAGTTNPRLMAAGVSAATVPTMAGLVAALSGYWFSVYYKKRVRAELTRLNELLTIRAAGSDAS